MADDFDHTTGQIKFVRGSGPPILAVGGETISVNDRLFVLSMARYGTPQAPRAARVIGIDLTRRTVRLQIVGGKEVLYTADSKNSSSGDASIFLFADAQHAKHNAVKIATEAMKDKTEKADRALADLEAARALLKQINDWQDAESWDVDDD